MDIALQNRYDLLKALSCIWCRGFRCFVFFRVPSFTYYRFLHVVN